MPSGNAGNYKGTVGDKPKEDGDEVRSSRPLWVGLHICYNGSYKGKQWSDPEQILKSSLSSDCRLQLACMKLESLVIVDQHATVNTFSGLVHTARQAMGVLSTRITWANRKEAV